MATMKSKVLQTQDRIAEHLEIISRYFQPGILFTLIGRNPENGCEFIIGQDDPKAVLNYLKRAIKKIDAEEKSKKQSVTKRDQLKPKKKSTKKSK